MFAKHYAKEYLILHDFLFGSTCLINLKNFSFVYYILKAEATK